MEVEVKMRLANAHRYVTTLLSLFHVIIHRQQNLFFNGTASELSVRRIVLCLRFYGYDECCVASLKARAVLVDGVRKREKQG